MGDFILSIVCFEAFIVYHNAFKMLKDYNHKHFLMSISTVIKHRCVGVCRLQTNFKGAPYLLCMCVDPAINECFALSTLFMGYNFTVDKSTQYK